MTELSRADLSIDRPSLALIIDSLICSTAEKIRTGQDVRADRQVLFQLFIADIKSQAAKPEEEEEKEEEKK